jgi:ankyrin repeat protein
VLSKMEKGLNDGNTVYELRESLKAIPRELSGLFGVLLDSIDAEYAEETNTMLSLILCSVQPLTLPEFRYAMAFCGKKTYLTQSQMLSSENVIQNDVTMIKRIRSRCGGLLETKASVDASNSGKGPSNMVVQFIHQSVKDYLSIRQESSSKILGSKELTAQGHKNFTQACLHYLSINDLRDLPSRLETLYHIPKSEKQLLFTKEFPFLNYSVSYWIQHYREAEIHGLSQWERLELFGQNNGVHFDTWCELRNWLEWFVISEIKQLFDSAGTLGPILLFDGDHMDTSIFQLAVNHNFLDYVRRALESGQEDANTHIKSWGSYLQLAAFRGHEEMVELLLRHDARVNAGTGGMTPLMAACFAGRAGTVRKLLEWEADVLSGGTFTNPLTAAAASGKWEIIEILLEHDKEIFQNGMYRHSALHTLSIFALWRRGFDYDDDDPEFTTEMVVFEEKKTDYAKIVDLLTAQGVEYEFFGPVAPWFQWLMISGSEKLVDTLAARGANLGIEDPQGVTLLHLAALGGNGEAVQSLVKNGANLFAQTKSGATIQHAAAANRVANALCYLLRLGLDPNVSDENETTPLHLAARNGSDIHLEALLSAGADPTTIDNKGCSPLHNAVANKRVTNDINILDALCPADSYINAWACNGLTPLHIAARHGSLSTVRWLVEKGADIHVVDEQDRTLLHAAAANKEDITADILDFLIGKGLDVAAVDDVGMTPLHNILYYKDGPFEYGRVLFGKEVDPFRSDVVAPSTFQACKARIRVLLSRGADMNAQDDSGSTLLHAACANSDRRVVKLLLEEGADKEIMDYRGCKPVDVAKRDEVRSLLELD